MVAKRNYERSGLLIILKQTNPIKSPFFSYQGTGPIVGIRGSIIAALSKTQRTDKKIYRSSSKPDNIQIVRGHFPLILTY